MLFSISVPDTGPYSSVKANVGSARFYGVEVELSSVNIRRGAFQLDDRHYVFVYPQQGVVAARRICL